MPKERDYQFAHPFENFRDRPESPFYCADGKTPEETWQAITDRLEDVLSEVAVALEQPARLQFSQELLCYWHKEIFEPVFPNHAGRLREAGEEVVFGITVGTRLTRDTKQRQGTDPKRLPQRLQRVCDEFNRGWRALAEQSELAPPLEAATVVIARLYAKLLATHPWVDGNLRASYVALQAGLRSLGLPMAFLDDLEAHNEALGTALRTDGQQSYEPFAELLAETLRAGQQGQGRP